MSNVARRSQPAYASGVFEVTEEIASTLVAQSGFRTVHSGNNRAGISGQTAFEHPILLSAYSGLGINLNVAEMYSLKCKIIAPNNTTPPHFIHEMSHNIHVGNSETFPGNLVDNTSIHSIGVITERRTVVEEQHGGRPTTVVIVRHTDWDPTSSGNVEFNIEYWCRPVRNLTKCQNLFQLGRELTITGFITDRDITRHMLQVDVYSVSVATGHENINAPTTGGTNGQGRTTRAGRVRLPRQSGSGTPLSSPARGSSAQSATGSVQSSPDPAAPVQLDAACLTGILEEIEPTAEATDDNVNTRARSSANSLGKRARGQ